MSEFNEEVQASDYGKFRAEQHRQHLIESAETAASVAGHAPTSAVLRRGQGGLYGSATGQDLAAQLAERPARTGDASGNGRALEYNGGLFTHAETGPAPARRDLRYVDQHQPPGISPLLAHMQGLDQ